MFYLDISRILQKEESPDWIHTFLQAFLQLSIFVIGTIFIQLPNLETWIILETYFSLPAHASPR